MNIVVNYSFNYIKFHERKKMHSTFLLFKIFLRYYEHKNSQVKLKDDKFENALLLDYFL